MEVLLPDHLRFAPRVRGSSWWSGAARPPRRPRAPRGLCRLDGHAARRPLARRAASGRGGGRAERRPPPPRVSRSGRDRDARRGTCFVWTPGRSMRSASSASSGTRRPSLPAERSAALGDALALWRGTAFADLAFEPFLQAEIARLDELRLTALGGPAGGRGRARPSRRGDRGGDVAPFPAHGSRARLPAHDARTAPAGRDQDALDAR